MSEMQKLADEIEAVLGKSSVFNGYVKAPTADLLRRCVTALRSAAESEPVAWRVTAGSGSERHLFENKRDAQEMRNELEENGWQDVAFIPLYATPQPARRDAAMFPDDYLPLDAEHPDNYRKAFARTEPCQTCFGDGYFPKEDLSGDTKCDSCQGTGTEPQAAPAEPALHLLDLRGLFKDCGDPPFKQAQSQAESAPDQTSKVSGSK